MEKLSISIKEIKMRSFKIYTENINQNYIQNLLNISFDGYTIIRTKGFWRGAPENAIIIEILTKNETLIKTLAKQIKTHNNQESVLVTSHDVDAELI